MWAIIVDLSGTRRAAQPLLPLGAAESPSASPGRLGGRRGGDVPGRRGRGLEAVAGGISVAHSVGAGGFRSADGADGELDSALTAVHPYLHLPAEHADPQSRKRQGRLPGHAPRCPRFEPTDGRTLTPMIASCGLTAPQPPPRSIRATPHPDPNPTRCTQSTRLAGVATR